jgi:hypothetical protein
LIERRKSHATLHISGAKFVIGRADAAKQTIYEKNFPEWFWLVRPTGIEPKTEEKA